MAKTYTIYTDPAHGWLKVTKAELAKLSLTNKISAYSYQRGGNVYLEEDGDASLFLNVLEAEGIGFKIKESASNKSSKIRNYESYRIYTAEEVLAMDKLRIAMVNRCVWKKSVYKKIDNASYDTLLYWNKVYSLGVAV